MFNRETIEVMTIHPSIERLYTVAKDLRDVKGQSAVARLLGVSPQVVKNWEARGLSLDGALLAQELIGCDANWLLKAGGQKARPTWAQEHRKISARVAEPEPAYEHWPFSRVTKRQYSLLSKEQKKYVEDGMILLLKLQESEIKQNRPDAFNAAA